MPNTGGEKPIHDGAGDDTANGERATYRNMPSKISCPDSWKITENEKWKMYENVDLGQ